MRIRYIATFAETIRTDPVTLAREYLSARNATDHEFQTEEARSAYVDVLSALGRFQDQSAFARALAHLDVGPEALDNTRQHNGMRSIAWSFGEGATFPGFTDDTTWNGFLNVRVPVSAWPYVLTELIAGADGDADTIEAYRRIGTADGLVCLSNGFATQEAMPTWPEFFPDYPVDTMVPIPSEWSEMSWRHETAPSFGPCVGPMGEAAQIWVDYELPAMREFAEAARFTFIHDDGRPSASAYLIDHDVDLDAQSLLFGAFKTYQRSVLAIEGLTNLDFGSLREFDGFSNEEKATGDAVRVLITEAEDIRL